MYICIYICVYIYIPRSTRHPLSVLDIKDLSHSYGTPHRPYPSLPFLSRALSLSLSLSLSLALPLLPTSRAPLEGVA